MKKFIENLETGKIELHFDKADYLALTEDLKSELKRFFTWSRYAGAWVSKSKNSHWHVIQLAKKLGFEEGEKQGERLTFAEELERKQERAERRADRYEEYAANAEKRAQGLTREREQHRGDISFWTQPNINSSRGRAFTRYRERVISRYMSGLEEYRKSEYFKGQAERLRGVADSKQLKSPVYLNNRIEEAQAEIRKLERLLKSAEEKQDETWAESLLEKMEYQIDKLAYFKNCMEETARALEESGRKLYTKEDLKPGYLYKGRHWWAKITRVNQKTVSGLYIEGPLTNLSADCVFAEIRAVKIPEDWGKEAQEIKNPFNTGDILTKHRPADDSIYQAYQVIKTTAKTVTLRRIEITKEGQPVKDSFISDKMERRNVTQNRSGTFVVNHDDWYLYRYDK